jgi:hypothetical protein
MANFKYFADIDGQAIELRAPNSMDNKEFTAKFPGVKGMRYGGCHFTKWIGYPVDGQGYNPREPLAVTRMIEYKANPSKHICNAKCLGGKATGVCECQCGGKNHGAGMFSRFVE